MGDESELTMVNWRSSSFILPKPPDVQHTKACMGVLPRTGGDVIEGVLEGISWKAGVSHLSLLAYLRYRFHDYNLIIIVTILVVMKSTKLFC